MPPIHTLAEVLRLLAAPFEEQIRVLPAFVVVADELALLFDEEMWRLGGAAEDRNHPATSVRSVLEALDARFDAMSGTKESWTLEADWVTYTRA